MELMYRNIGKLDRFIKSINENLEIGEIIDKEELRKDYCIKAIEANNDFFSQISKDDAFYFISKIGFVEYNDHKAHVIAKLILTNKNFLPINSNQDLVKIIKGFNVFRDDSKLILIDSLIKSKKTDFFKDIDLSKLCRLLISDLAVTSDTVKINSLEFFNSQNPNLLKNISYPVAVSRLLQELHISFDREKYEMIKFISSKKDIFRNVKDIYDSCFMVADLFMIRSNSIKHSLLKIIIESNPQMIESIESIDDLLKAINNLKMGQNVRDFYQFCELLIVDKPEIIGSVSNIEKIIEQVGFNSNSSKQFLIERAISLQKNKQDKAELTKEVFKNFIFLSHQEHVASSLIKRCIRGFEVDEKAELMQTIIDNQSPWNRGEFVLSLILDSAIENKELFLKLDFSNIDNDNLVKIFDEAFHRMELTHFEVLKLSKLINCDKYNSVISLLEKTGTDGIFKRSKIFEINQMFNSDNDNDFDVNKCRAIDFLNYLQLMDYESNFHRFFESNYLNQLKDDFVPRTSSLPINISEIQNIERVLKIKNLDNSFIKMSKIISIFDSVNSDINDVKVRDVESLQINEEAKAILSIALQNANQINRENASRFFNIILGEENNLDFSQENSDKLCYFLQRNGKDLCALLKYPQGLQSLHNAVYSIADGCVANIGNQMKMMVLESLIENREGKNAKQMLKLYQAVIEKSIVPLINSDNDFIGGEVDIMKSDDMNLYYIAPTDFFKQVASKFNGSSEVYDILSKEMGLENTAKLMAKCGVCDEDLTEFDEEKANSLGAYQAIKALVKKEEFAKILTKSESQVKDFCNMAKEAEKSITETATPSRTFAPIMGIRNLRASATNFFQRFANR